MEKVNLKNKIQITNEFLEELNSKSWQEIENLQSQIINIEANDKNAQIINLLNNLLTGYYVFVGGLENILDNKQCSLQSNIETNEEKSDVIKILSEPTKTDSELNVVDLLELDENPTEDFLTNKTIDDNLFNTDNFEPFEYFVDFDEPDGKPLTDEDLYGKH